MSELSPSPPTDWAKALTGPILVLGAGGFIGSNLVRRLLPSRSDVYAVVRRLPAWRLPQIGAGHLMAVNLANRVEMEVMIASIRPATVFYCAAYGAHSFEADSDRIYETNFLSMTRMIELLQDSPLAAFVHAGSSSEYGTNCAGPEEHEPKCPNSPYAVSKVATSYLITYAGQTLKMPVVNLRLYSVYGPYEDSSRLIPTLVKHGLDGKYPPLVSPHTSRDFVYVDDVCTAFLMAAARMSPELYGWSFNIASGIHTTIRSLAETARSVFGIQHSAEFGTMPGLKWDLSNWYGCPRKTREILGWTAQTPLYEGLRLTADWVRSLGPDGLETLTKRA